MPEDSAIGLVDKACCLYPGIENAEDAVNAETFAAWALCPLCAQWLKLIHPHRASGLGVSSGLGGTLECGGYACGLFEQVGLQEFEAIVPFSVFLFGMFGERFGESFLVGQCGLIFGQCSLIDHVENRTV